MSIGIDEERRINKFIEYVEFYPDEDEPGFDGIHYGGVKGIRRDAPESAKKAFAEHLEWEEELKKEGIKV